MSRPSNAWIDSLADNLKQQGRDAAEAYGRDQHRTGVITAQAPAFFTALTLCLEEDFAAIRGRLQGSAVASDTTVARISPSELHLTRARFPWFDATFKHTGDTIALDYAKERGTVPALTPNRQSAHFTFQVDAHDRLSLAESFADAPRSFTAPEDLSRHLVELLFTV